MHRDCRERRRSLCRVGARRKSGAAGLLRGFDRLRNTRTRIHFSTQLAKVDSSMLGVLKKVDGSFRIRQSQKYTAVNQDGFEVDIVRRDVLQADAVQELLDKYLPQI